MCTQCTRRYTYNTLTLWLHKNMCSFFICNEWRILYLRCTWYSEVVLEAAHFLKDLHTVIVGIRDHDVLIHAETEAVR